MIWPRICPLKFLPPPLGLDVNLETPADVYAL